MLDFVKRAFRNWIAGILWINVIMSTIVGGIAGHYLGQSINNRNSGGYTFLGILVGIVCGMVTNIIFGGFIATILGIEKNTAEQTALLKKHLGIQDVPADENRIDERSIDG
jgi:uncharacterized membrane protein YeaQ/YmgE (transglycosylase-associated protein family)